MLNNEIDRLKLPRTMLFYGPDGSGKYRTAIEVVRVLNCRESGEEGCGCPSCVEIERLISNDMFMICRSNLKNSFNLWKKFGFNVNNVSRLVSDLKRFLNSISREERYNKEFQNISVLITSKEDLEKGFADLMQTVLGIIDTMKGKSITIDMIREAQRFLSLKSGYGRYRVLIIDGAESMNEEAQNSFLKVSEDTPEGSLIILTAVSKDKLKPTIVSRCRVYRFSRLQEQQEREIIEERYYVEIDERYGSEDLSVEREMFTGLYKKLSDEPDNLEVLGEIADEINRRGAEGGFFEYILDLLRDRLDTLTTSSVSEISEFECLLKKTERTGHSIMHANTNREIALLDFLLNNSKDVVKYCNTGK